MHKSQQPDKDNQANAQNQTNATNNANATNSGYAPHSSPQSRRPPIKAKHQPVQAKHQPVQAKHQPVQAKQAPVQRQQYDTWLGWLAKSVGGSVSQVIGPEATKAIVNSPLGDAGRALYNMDQASAQVIDESVQEAGRILDEYIPIGSGISFKIEGGVTWAIPIRTAGGLLAYIKRASKDTIEYHVRAQGDAGFDVGVGGGVTIGGGKKSGQKSGLGAGVAASASAQAGTRLTGLMTYKIPVLDFINILGPQSIIEGIFDSEPSEWGRVIAEKAEQYQSKTKIEAKMFANASGELGAGIKGLFKDSGGNNKQESGWMKTLKELITLFGEGEIGGEFGGGVEIDFSDDDENVVNFYVEGGANAMLKIPFLSKYIGSLGGMKHGRGIGAKISVSYDKIKKEENKEGKKDAKEEKEDEGSNIGLALYTTMGDTDVFEGPAREVAIKIKLDQIKALPELMRQLQETKAPEKTQEKAENKATDKNQKEDTDGLIISDTDKKIAKLLSNFDKIEYTEQTPLLKNNVKGVLTDMISSQQGGPLDKLKNKLPIGIDFEVYSKFEMALEGEKLAKVIGKALTRARGLATAQDIYKDLSGYFSGGKSTLLQGLENDLAQAISVKDVLYRIQGGLSTGFSGELSAGLKAALNIDGGIGAFLEGKLIKEDENLNLQQALDKLSERVDKKLKELIQGNGLVGDALRLVLGDDLIKSLEASDESTDGPPRRTQDGGKAGGGW